MSARGLVAALLADTGGEEWVARVPARLGTFLSALPGPVCAAAVCRNSESADATVLLERWWGRWRGEASWTLRASAHAEVGDR
ncbi:hypothetical protein [Streptomyces sp. AF1B]|jgi:hypothetical protein|uniref:hypothetical protein n=1 Tax=Streptomyces sp. AF1B TaxID=3399503 RepID=UPI003AB03D4F